MDGQEKQLSIEETNRLRQQLGLKPLSTEEENETIQGTYRNPRWVQEESTEEQDCLKNKLEKQRYKRLERSVFDAKPLGLDLEEELENQMDTFMWVEKSRDLERQRKAGTGGMTTNKASKLIHNRQQPSTNNKVEERLEYIPEFVVGATEEDLIKSEELILTLKDRNVLDEEEDELENIQLREKQQALINQKLRRSISQRNSRGASFEEEFSESGNNFTEWTHSLLPKYDELDISKYAKNRVRLSSLTDKEREAVLRERVQNLAKQFSETRKEENASVSGTQIQEEYYTPKELLSFGKLKRASSKKKKNKNRRRDDDEEDLQDWTKSETQSNEHPQFDIDPQERLQRLQQLRFQNANTEIVSNGPLLENKAPSDNNQQTSSGWRKMRYLRERGADRVLSAIQESRTEMKNNESVEGNETLVLDDLTEFVYNLDPRSFHKGNRDVTEALSPSPPSTVTETSKGMETNASSNHEEEEHASTTQKYTDSEFPDNRMDNLERNQDRMEDNLESDLVSVGLEEEPVSMGVAAALKHLQMTGNLRWNTDQVGRTKDERVADARHWEEGSKRIKLEYVDEFGRELTPKEAFRQLSYKFHGKGPGKAKQEKRLRKYIQELRSKMLSSGDDTPLHSVRHLKDETKQSAVPYIVLQSSTLSKEMNSGELSRGRVTSTWEGTNLGKPPNRKKQTIPTTWSSSNISTAANEEVKEVSNASNVVTMSISNEVNRSAQLEQPERNKIAIQLGRNAKRKRPVLNTNSFE